jgi:hypothetical protein
MRVKAYLGGDRHFLDPLPNRKGGISELDVMPLSAYFNQLNSQMGWLKISRSQASDLMALGLSSIKERDEGRPKTPAIEAR